MSAPAYSKFLDSTRKKTKPEPSSLAEMKKQSLQFIKARMKRIFMADSQDGERCTERVWEFAEGSPQLFGSVLICTWV